MACVECENLNRQVVQRQQSILELRGTNNAAYFRGLEALLESLKQIKKQCIQCVENQLKLRSGVGKMFPNRPSVARSDDAAIKQHLTILERTKMKIDAITTCLAEKSPEKCNQWHK